MVADAYRLQTYAGIAFWGFGSFLAGAKFLLPVSKCVDELPCGVDRARD